jgi:lipopolysaccharide/colanic/teichoic acid biosynthesis glycosyltransferase
MSIILSISEQSIKRKQLNITIMLPFYKLFKIHYNTCQGYVRLANWYKKKNQYIALEASTLTITLPMRFPIICLIKISYCPSIYYLKYVRLANWYKKKNKNKLSSMNKSCEKKPTAHNHNILHVNVLYNIQAEHTLDKCYSES